MPSLVGSEMCIRDRTITDLATNEISDTSTEELVIDTSEPTVVGVTSTTPDGSYGAGQAVVINIQMSEDVTVDTTLGSPTLTLDAGTASFTGAAGNVLTFTYVSQEGDASADLDAETINTNGAVITDAAENAADLTLDDELKGAAAIVIDTTAPVAPVVVAQTTNSTPPTITGTNTALVGDEVLSVVVNGATYEVTPTGTPATNWSLDLAAAVPTSGTLGAFADGTYAVTATVTDEVGNEASTSVANALVIDTTAPSAPTVDALVADSTTPTITGTATLGDGETLTVTVSGATYSVTPEIDNTWSVDLATATPASGALVSLGDGNTYSVTATSTDAATNAVNDSTTEELVVDTTAPTIAAVSSSTADGSYGAGQPVVISLSLIHI